MFVLFCYSACRYFKQKVSNESSVVKISDEVPRDQPSLINTTLYSYDLQKLFIENFNNDSQLRWDRQNYVTWSCVNFVISCDNNNNNKLILICLEGSLYFVSLNSRICCWRSLMAYNLCMYMWVPVPLQVTLVLEVLFKLWMTISSGDNSGFHDFSHQHFPYSHI